jgi:hypothetical protein
VSAGWGTDPEKWLIKSWGGCWNVYPPAGSFWGRMTTHDTGEEALSDFRRQVDHGLERAWIRGLDRGLPTEVEDWHGKATRTK